jgi:hypothetical protein
MSDSLPENSFSGVIRVLKLTSGEEVIALVSEASPEKYSIKLPARLDTFYSRDENGELLEYVKLTNYLSNIKGFEINLPRDVVIYIGSPNTDLEKMYETYIIAMQQDPKVVITSGEIDQQSSEHGLQLLNELFNNEDFVNFVNDLIENFEGAEIVIEDDEGEEEEPEKPLIEPVKEEAPKPSKPKKRRTMNPEAKKLPYNPEANPNSAEGWSDNPNDYI